MSGSQNAIDDLNRAPLPAGDPQSWELVVQGTWLAGVGWPGWSSIAERVKA